MNIIDIIMRNTFETANEAYEYMHNEIITNGVEFAGTKALFNIGFTIENPTNKVITNKERNWKHDYAEAEWKWYMSGDRNISKLGEIYGKIPAIWKQMADPDGEVNSNYGWQWQRNNQLEHVIDKLRTEGNRQAAISIYDGKEINSYKFDTPCTYAVQFTVVQGKLYMSVYMRSNDLWYGFCNDQYQFASLQEMVADRLSIPPVGTYYHHAHNLHLYNDKI